MPQNSPETLEGKLIAQRQMLSRLLALHLMSSGDRESALKSLLENEFDLPDQQEDPGAVPTEAFAIEGAIAEERALIVEEARRLASAAHPDRTSAPSANQRAGQLIADKDYGVIRPAGPRAMRDAPREWDRVDEWSDESFPASDVPGNY